MNALKPLTLLVLSAAGCAAQSTTHLDQNFDSTEAGECPAGWSCNAFANLMGSAWATNHLSVSKPNSLAVVSTNFVAGEVWTAAIASLKPAIPLNSDRNVTVRCKLRFAQSDANAALILTDNNTATFIRLTFDEKGRVTAPTKDWIVFPLGDYSADLWYDVKLEFVPIKRTFDLTISTNDSVVISSTGLPFTGKPAKFELFYLQNFGRRGATPAFYVDDISILSQPK